MSVKPLLVLLAGLFNAAEAFAEDSATVTRQAGKIVSYTDVLQWLLALLIVLGLFALLIWLLRKSGNLAFANRGQLAVLAGLSLGMREKLVLVKVGEKQLLLGVSNGRIDKLLELEGEQRLFQVPEESAREMGLFAKKLQQVMQGKADV